MKNNRFFIANTVLYLIAAVIAGYLAYNHYALINGELGFRSFCNINAQFDCDAVNGSPYAEFLSIPLAVWGLAYYLFALLLNTIAWKNPYARRETLLLLLFLSFSSVLVTFVTFGITVGVLKTICIFCLSLYFCNLATHLLTVLTWKTQQYPKNVTGELKSANRKSLLRYCVAGVAVLLVAHLSTYTLKEPIPFDEEVFRAEFRAQPVQTVEANEAFRFGYNGATPPVQIVEFADFQCPACAFAAKHMHRLAKVYASKVQLAFKSFPLDRSCNPFVQARMHEHACFAAKAAICAQKFGHYETMFEKLFMHSHELSSTSITIWAKEMGIDENQFNACLGSEETISRLQKEMHQANTLGVQSTPTFFVNGKKVEGAIDEQRLKALFKELGV